VISIVAFQAKSLLLKHEFESTRQTRQELLEKLWQLILRVSIKPIDSPGLIRLQSTFCVESFCAQQLLGTHLSRCHLLPVDL